MYRVLLITLLSVTALTSQPMVAQDKKEAPKTLPRIAINDPAKLKDDADFAMQGEYLVEGSKGAKKFNSAAQVVAKGETNFDLIFYVGGLPGDGWDGNDADRATKGVRKDDTVEFRAVGVITYKLKNGVITNEIRYSAPVTQWKKVSRTSSTIDAKPPEGAVVLFGKPGDETNWVGGKLVELSDGKFLNPGIKSKQAFGSFNAHVEFRLPWMPNSRGQGRGNSGVYLQDRYEVQVLDSFGLKGENNECGGVYTQYKPLVNMCYPPMVWQTYDIDFTQAEFDADGKKTKPARLTMLHNDVKIHANVELKGPTGGGQPETAKPGPFQLQNHGDPVVYRNIWVVEKK